MRACIAAFALVASAYAVEPVDHVTACADRSVVEQALAKLVEKDECMLYRAKRVISQVKLDQVDVGATTLANVDSEVVTAIRAATTDSAAVGAAITKVKNFQDLLFSRLGWQYGTVLATAADHHPRVASALRKMTARLFGVMAAYCTTFSADCWHAPADGKPPHPDLLPEQERTLTNPSYLSKVALLLANPDTGRSGAISRDVEAVKAVITEGLIRERVTMADFPEHLLVTMYDRVAQAQWGGPKCSMPGAPATCTYTVVPACDDLPPAYNVPELDRLNGLSPYDAALHAPEPTWYNEPTLRAQLVAFDEAARAPVQRVLDAELTPIAEFLGQAFLAGESGESLALKGLKVKDVLNLRFMEYKYKSQTLCAYIRGGVADASEIKGDKVARATAMGGVGQAKGLLSPNSPMVMDSRKVGPGVQVRDKTKWACEEDQSAKRTGLTVGDLGKPGKPVPLTAREIAALVDAAEAKCKSIPGQRCDRSVLEKSFADPKTQLPWASGIKMNYFDAFAEGTADLITAFQKRGGEVTAGPSGTTDMLLANLVLLKVDSISERQSGRLAMTSAVVPYRHHSIYEVVNGAEFYVQDYSTDVQKTSGKSCVEPYYNFMKCRDPSTAKCTAERVGVAFDQHVDVLLNQLAQVQTGVAAPVVPVTPAPAPSDSNPAYPSPCGLLAASGSINALCESMRYAPELLPTVRGHAALLAKRIAEVHEVLKKYPALKSMAVAKCDSWFGTGWQDRLRLDSAHAGNDLGVAHGGLDALTVRNYMHDKVTSGRAADVSLGNLFDEPEDDEPGEAPLQPNHQSLRRR